MPSQPRLPIPTGLATQFSPVGSARSGARAAAEEIGGAWNDAGLGDVMASEERKHATGLAYRDALLQPEQMGIRQSYEVMRDHVNRQYERMTKPREQGGLGFVHEITPHDPYAGPEEMAEDLRQGRIRTLATASTGKHEFFTDEENDRFRAVHDVYGHAATGRGFSRHGEEAAYQSHVQAFPESARPALASETRGQNSYLNTFGHFASQEGKLVGLPDWVHDDSKPIPPRSPFRTQRTGPRDRFEQQTLF